MKIASIEMVVIARAGGARADRAPVEPSLTPAPYSAAITRLRSATARRETAAVGTRASNACGAAG